MTTPTDAMAPADSDAGMPGDFLLHPLNLAMLLLWIVNDHLLKSWLANGWTGKLSDVASLVCFPLLVVAAYEVAASWLGRRWWRSRKVLWCALMVTGLVMVTINTSPFFARCYQEGLGLAQWPYFAAAAWFNGAAIPPPGLVHLTMDPTDLYTLPALALSWSIWSTAHRRKGRLKRLDEDIVSHTVAHPLQFPKARP